MTTEAIETLSAATVRLETAHERVRVAALAQAARVPTAPLRSGVAAMARLRAAERELSSAEAAFALAQNAPAPAEE